MDTAICRFSFFVWCQCQFSRLRAKWQRAGHQIFEYCTSRSSLLQTGISVVGRYVETRLGRPSLVRETSRLSYRHPYRYFLRFWSNWREGKTSKASRIFDGLILQPSLQEKLTWLATATQNTLSHGAPYRNILLHGRAGTGKTLFAKRLALSSGLDYAIITGGDFAQLGHDAVTELHKVFDWAENSKRY